MSIDIQPVRSERAPAPGGAYEQAVVHEGRLYTSGVVGLDPGPGTVPASFREEVRRALANLDAVLNAGGASRQTVLKTLCFLTDTGDFTVFNEEYARFFGTARPARSTIGVALAGGYRFEIEAVAAVEATG